MSDDWQSYLTDGERAMAQPPVRSGVLHLLRTVAQLRELVQKKDKALRRGIKMLTIAANHISPEYRGKGQIYDDALEDIQPVASLVERKSWP